MKKILCLSLALLLLTGCSKQTEISVSQTVNTSDLRSSEIQLPYRSQYLKQTTISLSDAGITVDGNQESVTVSRDIVYYEDRISYDSGNPYGEGTDSDRHTAEEAAAHTVVNIQSPGAYRITGTLSAGQIRVDLGEDARSDPDATVELILEDADITCTVAPAILFRNVYECDANRSANAGAEADTEAAGAILVLEGSNTVHGSYVAKIFQDAEGEKKLVKQDGAIYSYMSMNVFGPGSLELTAENEGIDTEQHLTINGGNIHILSDNDGINTNNDGISVTTVNGGNLTIHAGLGDEGDGIDSNGYLVINGGRVIASANPAADAGLDSDLGTYINGGTVVAVGAAMDGAHQGSQQATMNLQFARQQSPGSRLVLTNAKGDELFSFLDDTEAARSFTGMILSHPGFSVGETYNLLVNDTKMAHSGNLPGNMPGGGMNGGMPNGGLNGNQNGGLNGDQNGGANDDQNSNMPGGGVGAISGVSFTMTGGMGGMPGGFGGMGGMPGGMGGMPGGFGGRMPSPGGNGNMSPFGGFSDETPTMPEDETMPSQFGPPQQGGQRPGYGQQPTGSSTDFTLTGTVSNFTGITAAS